MLLLADMLADMFIRYIDSDKLQGTLERCDEWNLILTKFGGLNDLPRSRTHGSFLDMVAGWLVIQPCSGVY